MFTRRREKLAAYEESVPVMRRFTSIFVPIVLAACTTAATFAQRGGGHVGGGLASPHVGFSSHAGGSFSRMGSPYTLQAPRTFARPTSFPRGAQVSHYSPSAAWRSNGHWNRGPYGRFYAPYSYWGYGTYLGPNVVGYPFGFDSGFWGDDYDDDQQSVQSQSTEAAPEQGYSPEQGGTLQPGPTSEQAAAEEYGAPPPPTAPSLGSEAASGGQPSYRAPYNGTTGEEAHAQPATTLIFNDGKPSIQIHNYVITRTTLYGLDEGARVQVPISEIDVPATVASNRAAGVDFSLPASR
jgi:hypothetical protein